MKQRSLGSLQVSEVGIGCNNFGARLDQEGTNNVVNGALDAGINFFDTADVYGATQSEVFLGKALGSKRADVVIASKFGMPLDDTRFGASAAYVRAACDDSLKRLGTDYIDLYQLHFPDVNVPIAETLGALGELVAAGKVREIGCSNFNVEQLREADAAAGNGPKFVSVQNQYSLVDRSPERDGVLDVCAELGLGFLPFYPLANGLLTGKIRPGQPLPENTRLATMAADRSAHWLGEELQLRVTTLLDYAESINVPILTLAFSWLLKNASIPSVIAGASTAEQIRANVAAVTELSQEHIDEINKLTA
jgi:aryl-alcohol dehydrogenase-like predicted oxidoreductase